MHVTRAAKAGFCFGVKRALDMAEKTIQSSVSYSLGPLIHNHQVVERLKRQGIDMVDTVGQVGEGQTLIIRSHGVAPDIYAQAERKKIKVVDATCPFVQKAQRLAAESALNSQVIVVGDKLHPEVRGILGWAGHQAIPIETLAEAEKLPVYPHIAVLAQTTQTRQNFTEIIAELKKHTPDLKVHNTICNATEERQEAARELAETADVMVVVGGRNSANTRKLAAICSESTDTYLVESADELEENWFTKAKVAGLTAGASTPDWIIEEVYKKMTEMNEQDAVTENKAKEAKDENMENWDQSLSEVHRGGIVHGTVVKVTSDEVFVDIGWKSEGVIKPGELSVGREVDPHTLVAVGDEISAVVLRLENEEGYTLLSKRRVDEQAAIEDLERKFENKEELQAQVVEVVKGGLLVDIGMRGFVPASQIQQGYVEDLNQFLGQTLRLRLIDFDAHKKKAVLSQKVILNEEQAQRREQLFDSLKEGDRIKGVVKRLASFGAFVDVGGVDGLLHISDMAFSRIKHPSELLKVGDEIEVQVLRVDKESGKLSLGLKQTKPNPWDSVGANYPVGDVVTGKVVRITTFGAFVQLEDGVDGLVHISQLTDHHVAKVEDVVKVGETIRAKVIECRPEDKRISLSIKEAVNEEQIKESEQLLTEQGEIPTVTIGDAVGEIPADAGTSSEEGKKSKKSRSRKKVESSEVSESSADGKDSTDGDSNKDSEDAKDSENE